MTEQFWRIILATAILLSLAHGNGNTAKALSAEAQSAEALFDAMTVEERVGQLFLVTVPGRDTSQGSDIADLIINHRVGGIVLLAENNNIVDPEDTTNVPHQVAALANELQRIALTGQPAADVDENGEPVITDTLPVAPEHFNTPLPLFIATSHEGDNYPNINILSGLTEIPSNMAIGATWQPPYAEMVGNIVGEELSAIGINMMLGPSLDVLENPTPLSPADLGTRSFGGDPYWVGVIGKAYTQGVHTGSQGRLAVIAKHFPGNGSSDRAVSEEVPTVRKSLEQLKQIELAPFFAVTAPTNEREATVDGLLTTHIRYQGFQGNIRATTNPISFDRQALTTLMQLSEFENWRRNGGLIVSDSLGVRSVVRFYDDTEQEFPHRRVAKEALLAGNDLLFLSDFGLEGASFDTQIENVRDTIRWFREIYETDLPFQQRVDEAVLRILEVKLRLYEEDFSLANAQVEMAAVDNVVGQNHAVLFDLAQDAITLISPSQAELAERLISPPGLNDQIIIFTDIQSVRQCSECPLQLDVSETALEERILALYGPEASAQVQAEQIQSFTLEDLQAFLDAGPGPIPPPEPTATPPVTSELEIVLTPEPPTPIPTPTPPPAFLVQEALGEADWIIFAVLRIRPESRTLSNFLAKRPDIVHDTRVIVFAYDAPYYLDTTEISKLTAYFAVYSKTDAFIDASVRALFQESLLTGVSPVDVEGVSYDLFTQTQPDPEQVIELYIVSEGEPQAPPSEAPLEASIGDTLRLQTGVIRDHNGNPVPDGTLVQFIQLDRIQGVVSIIAEVTTASGVAQLDYVLEARTGAGQFRITAVSGTADVSQEVDISIEEEAQVAIITPTPMPTRVPTATPTYTPTPTQTPTPTPSPTFVPTPPPEANQEPAVRIELSEFQMLLAVFVGLLIVGNFGLLIGRRKGLGLPERMGWPLWGLTTGLLVYDYYALDLPGSADLPDLGIWNGLLTTLTGGLVGLIMFQLRLWFVGWRKPTSDTKAK